MDGNCNHLEIWVSSLFRLSPMEISLVFVHYKPLRDCLIRGVMGANEREIQAERSTFENHNLLFLRP